jgi:hypothetical protein
MSKDRKRYLVEWTPWADVYAAALKAGMVKDEEVSDFVEIGDTLGPRQGARAGKEAGLSVVTDPQRGRLRAEPA